MANRTETKRESFHLGAIITEYSAAFMIIIIAVVMSLISDAFLTTDNIINVVRVASIKGIMACGMTFLIIYSGGVDLSIGLTMSFVGLIGVTLEPVYGLGVAIVVGLGLGIVIGMVNGAILAMIKGSNGETFIITLGMQSVIFGIAQIYSGGYEIRASGSEAYAFIGKGSIGAIPFPTIIFFAVALISHFLLTYTEFGRKVRMIGVNKEAAKLAGANTELCRIIVFAFLGFTAAIAGLVLSSRIAAGSARVGVGYEFDVIASVVIGGTSMLGGEGSIVKTIFGVLLLSLITNALDLAGIRSEFQYIVKGVIIIIAVGLDVIRKRRENG